jgi:putative transcriptional regulator
MIKCHLSRLMGERKLKIADVAREIGVHRNTVTLLYYEKAQRIDFEVLDKLCKYFNCKVEDILEYK